MPKRKPFSSFVHIPQDLDFKIREGIPTGFYLVEGGGGAWIYYGGMEGNQPSGMKIPTAGHGRPQLVSVGCERRYFDPLLSLS
jgi:hypothetical protein